MSFGLCPTAIVAVTLLVLMSMTLIERLARSNSVLSKPAA